MVENGIMMFYFWNKFPWNYQLHIQLIKQFRGGVAVGRVNATWIYTSLSPQNPNLYVTVQ